MYPLKKSIPQYVFSQLATKKHHPFAGPTGQDEWWNIIPAIVCQELSAQTLTDVEYLHRKALSPSQIAGSLQTRLFVTALPRMSKVPHSMIFTDRFVVHADMKTSWEKPTEKNVNHFPGKLRFVGTPMDVAVHCSEIRNGPHDGSNLCLHFLQKRVVESS